MRHHVRVLAASRAASRPGGSARLQLQRQQVWPAKVSLHQKGTALHGQQQTWAGCPSSRALAQHGGLSAASLSVSYTLVLQLDAC